MTFSVVRILRGAGPIVSALVLASCGGSGGENSGTGMEFSFAAAIAQAEAFESATSNLDYTDPSTLPTSGSFTYDGVLGVTLDDGSGVAGQMTLNIEFGSDDVFGKVRNIVDDSEAIYQGRLKITGGSIDRAVDPSSDDFTFKANLGGTVTSLEGETTVDGMIFGDFLGDDYQYVIGNVSGTATTPEGLTDIDGSFGGER